MTKKIVRAVRAGYERESRVPRRSAMSLFPPKKRTKERPQVVFRAPEDVETYLRTVKDRGYKTTEVIVRLLRLARDVEAQLGEEMSAVQALASAQDVSVGEMLGRLARIGLAEKAEKVKR